MKVTEPCCVEIIRSSSALEALEPEWRELWRADKSATPFQSPEWLLPWWRSVGEGELCSVALRGVGGRLIGLLPIYVYTQPRDGTRDALLLGAGTSDYLGGLFEADSRAAEVELARIALDAAREAVGKCADRVILHQLERDSVLLEAGRASGMRVGQAEPCSIVSTDLGDLPSPMRLNLRRYGRRAEREGILQFRVAETAGEAGEALEALIAMHSRRWEARGESGVLAAATIQRHHREAVPELQRAGLLRMMTLSLGEEMLGVLYALLDPERQRRGRRCYGYLIGMERSRGELSPGSLLLERVLGSLAADGVSCFDMLRGAETYKRFWGAKESPTYSLQYP